jgi:hypothetical protein
MIADLEAFIQHVGAEHVDLDRLMRYLFHRHRPRALDGALEDAEQKLDVRFAPNTRARARRAIPGSGARGTAESRACSAQAGAHGSW